MSRPRAEIVQRIRMCRNLADPAKNSNEHERDTAKSMADRLMTEYGVTEAEVSGGSKEEYEVGDTSVIFTWNGVPPPTGRGWHGTTSLICDECGYYGSDVIHRSADSSRKPLCRHCKLEEGE